jgi:hypothetical protein
VAPYAGSGVHSRVVTSTQPRQARIPCTRDVERHGRRAVDRFARRRGALAIEIGHYACVEHSPNRLPLAVQNSSLSTPERAVWYIDTIRCRAGDKLAVAFEDVAPTWRHGVWLGVQGELEVGDIRAPQLVLWAGSALVVEVRVLASDDHLVRLYNVWDSGRGIRPHESQRATSGMLREELDGALRYRCSAIAADPQFDALTFTVTHNPAP